MDALTAFGLFAVSAMLVCYALARFIHQGFEAGVSQCFVAAVFGGVGDAAVGV